MAASPYAKLEARFARLSALGDAQSILAWDQRTIMPVGAAEARGEQIAAIQGVRHGLMTAPETADLLDAAEDGRDGLDDWQAANLAAMRRGWRHATAVDEDLVTALSRASSNCESIWREARRQADFARVAPSLKHLLGLVRQAAAAKAEALDLDPYDALLDQYEPDGRAADIVPLFDDLSQFLPDFLGRVLDHQGRATQPEPITGPVAAESQQRWAVAMMARLGFDFTHGRLDISDHPFSGGLPRDQRITTRYDEADPLSGFMAVLHETGHALYEAGLPTAWQTQPVGQARGMSIHESQSLLVEMQVGRSRPFLAAVAEEMAETLGVEGPAWDAGNLYATATRVSRGFIRVDADEVTYPAHVMLRFDLERALIAGDMTVADIPAAWNAGMERLLGVTPPSDREGCLQDIHWYDGAFGYFPTYTLGAMTAAQLMAAARDADPAIDDGIARADLAPLLDWLRANIHAKASSLPTPALVAEATGEPLSTTPFKEHLKARYLG